MPAHSRPTGGQRAASATETLLGTEHIAYLERHVVSRVEAMNKADLVKVLKVIINGTSRNEEEEDEEVSVPDLVDDLLGRLWEAEGVLIGGAGKQEAASKKVESEDACVKTREVTKALYKKMNCVFQELPHWPPGPVNDLMQHYVAFQENNRLVDLTTAFDKIFWAACGSDQEAREFNMKRLKSFIKNQAVSEAACRDLLYMLKSVQSLIQPTTLKDFVVDHAEQARCFISALDVIIAVVVADSAMAGCGLSTGHGLSQEAIRVGFEGIKSALVGGASSLEHHKQVLRDGIARSAAAPPFKHHRSEQVYSPVYPPVYADAYAPAMPPAQQAPMSFGQGFAPPPYANKGKVKAHAGLAPNQCANCKGFGHHQNVCRWPRR